MSFLDRQTLEKLADLIIGEEDWTPKQRGGYELSLFFEECGFLESEYDGSSRRPWVLQHLRKATQDQLTSVILRLASPKEYGGNAHDHPAAVAALNAILAVEGLQVKIGADLTPRIEKTQPNYSDGLSSIGNGRVTLERPNFTPILEDSQNLLLEARWREAQVCFENGAYLATIIMIGSVLETVLLLALRRNYEVIRASGIERKDRIGSPKPFHKWELGDMIDVAHALGWTKTVTKQFEHVIREYRNVVHPEVQLRQNFEPGSEECRIAALVVSAVLRDISGKINVGKRAP